MAVNTSALLMTIAFYVFVLGIGIWASVKSKKLENAGTGWLEMSFLANRSVSLFVGIFTMTGERRIGICLAGHKCHWAECVMSELCEAAVTCINVMVWSSSGSLVCGCLTQPQVTYRYNVPQSRLILFFFNNHGRLHSFVHSCEASSLKLFRPQSCANWNWQKKKTCSVCSVFF